MTITWIQVVWVSGLLVGWSGFLIGIIRWLIGKLFNRLEESIIKDIAELKQGNQENKGQYQRIDSEFRQFLIAMPIDYVRREDFIREYTTINIKLDRLNERMLEAKNK